MGIVLGLTAAFCFSLTSVLVRIGQRTRPNDDGVFISVLVNVIVLGIYAALVPWPAWDTSAMISFIIGGVIGTVGGRTSLLRAVRLIGPSRSNAFLTGTPAVAALAGWLALGETLTPIEVLGGTIVALGLLWLIRARSGDAGGGAPRRRSSITSSLQGLRSRSVWLSCFGSGAWSGSTRRWSERSSERPRHTS